MSYYVNVGAKIQTETDTGVSLEYIQTKTKLRRALADNPSAVLFESTTAIGPDVGKTYRGDEIPTDGIKLQVCGPDPYNDRVWNARVELRDGQPRVVA